MHGIIDHIFHVVAQHWLVVSVAVLSLWLARNRYHNGLSKYPGPFLASITDWWRFFDVYGRRPEVTHRALHKKYGDVVRLGPNTLSFSDPKALKTIYGLNKGFIKVCQFSGQHQTSIDDSSSPTFTSSNNQLQKAIACSPSSARQTTTSMRVFAVA